MSGSGTAVEEAPVEQRHWNEWAVDELQETIVEAINAGFRRTFFIWGQRGLGKSAIVKQAAMICNAVVVDRRLSMMDPADIRGVLMARNAFDQARINAAPDNAVVEVHTNAQNLAVWMLNPDFFPTLKPGQRLVIFLDEFNHAPDMIQKAAYEMAWDHSIGGVPFPEGTVIILAGNQENENSNVTTLDKPMRRRVIHCYAKYDWDAYWKYAEKRFHPLVTAYHRKHPEKVNQPIDNDTVDHFGEPLPATWEVVSDILRTFSNTPRRSKLIAGTVGPGEAQVFGAWCETEAHLEPIIEAVIKGENKTAEMVDQQFFVCQSVAEYFRKDRTLSTRIMEYAEAIKEGYAEVGGVMLQTAMEIDHDALRADASTYRRTIKKYYEILV